MLGAAAILECGPGAAASSGLPGTPKFGSVRGPEAGGESAAAPASTSSNDSAQTAEGGPRRRKGGLNFWSAWRALDPRNESDMIDGLEVAKQVQAATIRQAGLALTRRDVRESGASQAHKYRYYDMSGMEGLRDVELLREPLALSRLGMFLQDCHLQQRNKLRPHIVVGPPDGRSLCCVVAVMGRPQLGGDKHNPFAIAFKQAAEECNAQYRSDSFEEAIIEVSAQDAENFVSQVELSLEDAIDKMQMAGAN